MKKYIPNLIITLSILVTITLWYLSKEDFNFSDNSYRYLGQLSGLLAFVMLGYVYLLSSRLKFVEKIFGGLDKVYRFHHIVGGLAYTFIVLHPTMFILEALPSFDLAKLYFFPSEIREYNLGILAFYSFSILIFVTLFMKLPYHIWKMTHTLMGVPLIFSMLHVSAINSDKDNFPPLQVWLMIFTLIALFSYIYKVVVYNFLLKNYEFVVIKTESKGDVIEVYLKPLNRVLNFVPGQFIFISFINPNITAEFHPYSISSEPNNEYIRLSIKALGDHTKTLINLKEGDRAKVKGPYGYFGDRSLMTSKPQVWIAGGIGVTPFLSMINYIVKNNLNKNIYFFYSTKNEVDSIYSNEITELAKKNSGIKLYIHRSDTEGFLSSKFILDKTGVDPKKTKFFICGPTIMMYSLRDQFKTEGAKDRNIIFEDFSFR